MLTRVRVEALMSTFCRVLLAAGAVMTLLLIVYVWPFSRPALLIPLIWWAMFVCNKYLVTGPVLGLVDVAAERAGFDPVHDQRAKKPGLLSRWLAHVPGRRRVEQPPVAEPEQPDQPATNPSAA
jgi:hypothetical protein